MVNGHFMVIYQHDPYIYIYTIQYMDHMGNLLAMLSTVSTHVPRTQATRGSAKTNMAMPGPGSAHAGNCSNWQFFAGRYGKKYDWSKAQVITQCSEGLCFKHVFLFWDHDLNDKHGDD